MIALLSPAKTLDWTTAPATRKATQPRLLHRAEELIAVMRTKSPDEVAELMGVSAELAELNVARYRDFSTPFTRRTARPAVLAFAGDVYQGLAAPDRFTERDFTEAQKVVRIISGLYGLLRPLDLIQPYRLEMGIRLQTAYGTALYDFWGTTITDLLAADLAASPGPAVVVDLASQEYGRAVDQVRLGARVITPRFLDEGPAGDLRMVSFAAKRARGEMAAWLVLQRVRSVRALRSFDGGGYRFDPSRSTPDSPVYVRPRAERPDHLP